MRLESRQEAAAVSVVLGLCQGTANDCRNCKVNLTMGRKEKDKTNKDKIYRWACPCTPQNWHTEHVATVWQWLRGRDAQPVLGLHLLRQCFGDGHQLTLRGHCLWFNWYSCGYWHCTGRRRGLPLQVEAILKKRTYFLQSYMLMCFKCVHRYINTDTVGLAAWMEILKRFIYEMRGIYIHSLSQIIDYFSRCI